jgi:hypothetical protein
MHQSWGWWRVAFTKEFIDKISGEIGWTQDDREIEKWLRPAEIAPGVMLAYRLVIPEAAVTIQDASDDEDVVWLPPPPKEMAIEISFLLTSSEFAVSAWPGKSMGTELIGTLPFENGETLWLVHRVTPVPQLSGFTGQPTWLNSYANDKLPTEGLRAIAFGTSDDGSKFLFEAAVVRDTPT